MKKLILVSFLILFAASTVYAAPVDPTTSAAETGDNTGATKSKRKGSTRKQTHAEDKEKGDTASDKQETGNRKAVRREMSHAIEQAQERSLSQEVSVPSLFYQSLAGVDPVFQADINSVLFRPVAEGGVVYSTRVDFLQKMATNRQPCENYIDVDKVRQLMTTYAQAGRWIRLEAGKIGRLTGKVGLEDIQDLADLIVEERSGRIADQKIKIPISGKCIFDGDYTHIQCGSCVLDLGNKQGMPELVCASKRIFSSDSADGASLKVSVSDRHSIREAQTLAESDEDFKAISHSLDTYVRNAVKDGKGVEAMEAKELALSQATSSSQKASLATRIVSENDDAQGLLSKFGIK
jgi:hypothetical protein